MNGKTPNQNTLISKLLELRNILATRLVQRENEIHAVLSTLLARETCILVGDVGTGKTMLISELAKHVGGKFFYYLLTRYTEPDELFGALDVKAYREGKVQRMIQNTSLDADIVMLDEIFKSSSAIRNTLLNVFNERIYRYGDQIIHVNWLAVYTASNEISTDEEDRAFYDRLLVRVFVRYVTEDAWEKLIDSAIEYEYQKFMGNGSNEKPIISIEEIRQLQTIVIERYYKAKNNQLLKEKLIEARKLLKQRGVEMSDRRMPKILKIASAISILYNENDVSLDSLADALRYCAIHSEDDVQKVEEVIMEAKLSSIAEQVQRLQNVIAELRRIYDEAQKSNDTKTLKALVEARKNALLSLKNVLESKNPRILSYLREFKELDSEVKAFIERKKKELFGE